MSDEQLVARFRAGHDDAFAEIHRRHRPALMAFATMMLRGSGHDPDDVVQDAFIRAHRGLRCTAGPMAVRAWLHMIVRNRAVDELRSSRQTVEYDETRIAAAGWHDDPAQRVSEQDDLRRIVEEIGRLGIARMTAFEADPVIFYYSEILDEGAWDRLWESEVHDRWAELFKTLIAFNDDEQVDARFMDEIFHLDTVSA